MWTAKLAVRQALEKEREGTEHGIFFLKTCAWEKGMYDAAGRSFTQVLEELDPSEALPGHPAGGLDAFQRQLKRFDIKVKGAGSDVVEKFFLHGLGGAVPGVHCPVGAAGHGGEQHPAGHHRHGDRVRRHGLPLHRLRARGGQKLRRVEEGRAIPATTVKTQENLVQLHKRGGCWWPPTRPSGSSGWTCSR